MDKLKTVQANSSLPLPQPTLSVAGFRSDNGMCFNQFALFTIFESIIYRVYGMICHLPTGDRSSTSLNLLLTNFRVNRSKTEIVSQKTKLLLGSTSLTWGTQKTMVGLAGRLPSCRARAFCRDRDSRMFRTNEAQGFVLKTATALLFPSENSENAHRPQ